MAGHLLSPLLAENPPAFPYTALVVSGGNTSLFAVDDETTFVRIGRTRDDAAGEAFDKVAKLLDLGYPGGPAVSRKASQGDPEAFAFPRAWLEKGKKEQLTNHHPNKSGQQGDESHGYQARTAPGLHIKNLDFSFSGLKTSVVNKVNQFRQKNMAVPVADICASFEAAVVDVLTRKTVLAATQNGHKRVVMGGGVACNQRLRREMARLCTKHGMELFIPEPIFCTDNAAMIGLAGLYQYKAGNTVGPDADAYSRSPLY